MTAHWHYSGPKEDHADDMIGIINTPKEDVPLLKKALMKMTKAEIKTLYHYTFSAMKLNGK